MTNDEITIAVCNLVRGAMGMPAKSVRPADQMLPAGGQVTELATVKIISADDLGEPAITNTVSADPTKVGELVETPRVIVASVQFFRSAAKDGVGLAKWSTSAFDRASRLPLLLGLSQNVATMRAMGLGFLKASQARNLSALADSVWESRGSVDLTFNVIASETGSVDKIASVPLTIITQTPDQTTSIEVTSP